MIPILFEHDATTFTDHGLGDLVDTISCSVKQSDTNEFELELKYPLDGRLFSELKVNRIIYAQVNSQNQTTFGLAPRTISRQAFRIYSVEKEFAGFVTVRAQHVSYDLSHVYFAITTDWPTDYYGTPIAYASASRPNDILNWIQTKIISGTNNFNITCSGYGSGTWNNVAVTAREPRSVRSVLFDTDNSLLSNFGGICSFDSFNIKFYDSPANQVVANIEYGDDLIDLNQAYNISEMITGILPYRIGKDFVYFEDDSYNGLESITFGNVIKAEGTFERENIVPVDLSEYFAVNRNDPRDSRWSNLYWEEFNGKYIYKPMIDSIARSYANSIDLGIPDINIALDHVNTINPISLYDIVQIHFEKLGVDARARVTSTTYDVLNERNTEIEVGKSKASRIYNGALFFGNEYTGKKRIT